MAKYDPLHQHLTRQGRDRLTMTLDEIAALIPGGLPASAYNHQAWWANQTDGGHTHALACSTPDTGPGACRSPHGE